MDAELSPFNTRYADKNDVGIIQQRISECIEHHESYNTSFPFPVQKYSNPYQPSAEKFISSFVGFGGVFFSFFVYSITQAGISDPNI